MTRTVTRAGVLALLAVSLTVAGDEKAVVGTYALVKRVAKDGKEIAAGADVLGQMTFTKTRRSVIMRWKDAEGQPVSIAYLAGYSLDGGKYCEHVIYGVQSNLGAPGVSYDPPTDTPACTAAVSDATGLSFDIPNEKLRFRMTRDGFIATTPRWTDHWEKVK
jgi:hypothetical protein